MIIKNLTPHALKLERADGSFQQLPVDGPAPRLVPSREPLGSLNGLRLVRTSLGEPVGLPEPKEDTLLVVSALVAEHPSLASRADLAYPGEAIRDADGKIVGARGLCAGPGLAAKLRN